MRYKVIDSDKEHVEILFELRQLDDMDNWELYQQQERLLDNDIDVDTWRKYTKGSY